MSKGGGGGGRFYQRGGNMSKGGGGGGGGCSPLTPIYENGGGGGGGGVQSTYGYIRKLGGGGGGGGWGAYENWVGGAVRLQLYNGIPQDKRINSSHINFKYDATRNLIFVKRVRVTREGAAIAARWRHFIRHGGGRPPPPRLCWIRG